MKNNMKCFYKILIFALTILIIGIFMKRTPGYVILLNGVSSSGKTAIINEIQKLNKQIKILKVDDWFPEILIKKAESLGWKKESQIDPWLYLYEYVHKKTGKWYFNTQVREILFDEATDLYQKAKDIAADGTNVIIDTVLEYEKEYKTFDDFFKNDNKVLKVLVYCPMNVLLERVEKRNQSGIIEEYRTSFQSFEQFPAMYKVQENTSEVVVDIIKCAVLKQTLEKSLQDLTVHKIPEPYVPKLEQFKNDFIKQFKLEDQDEIILVAKHKYDLILNSFKNSPEASAKEIEKLICLI